ncbi:nucleotidyltransferase domain-containing protein [Candidatus Woesearchaeota archaeon]|nr:nucleotidyltransferase domain-containing protein [Candidatus Woesearchaeota archaeon]
MKIGHSTELKRIARKYKLELLLLFGSQAKGGTHSKSDIDLAFFSQVKIDEQRLYEDIMKIFRRGDVDLINLYTTHNHSLRYEILSKGLIIYERKKGIKSKMEGQSFIDYLDFQRYYTLRSKLLDSKLSAMVS